MPIGSTDGWRQILVPSKSEKGEDHQVLYPPWDEGPVCDCRGFRFRGKCSHLDAAEKRRDEMTKVKAPKKATLMDQIDAAESMEEKLMLLTTDLGKTYDKWKATEETKDTRKGQFFDLLTDYIESQVPLERVTERVMLKDTEDIDVALKTRYPDMRVVISDDGEPLMEENPDNDREWIVVMESDPAFMKYSFVNTADEMVYARGRVERGASFDVLGLVAEFPELAEQCVTRTVTLSVPTGADLTAMSVDEMLSLADENFKLDETKAEALVVADPNLMPVFMKFRVAPKVSLSLLKPREAKADEL